MASIFKAYDIRGVYGSQLTEDLAYKIGRAFATFLKCKKVVVGRDMRPHSQPLFDALARGLVEQGAVVTDLGLCSTPMCYYANGKLGADAGIMITASHNPGEYNGFKMCREDAIPISGATGIKDIERIVLEEKFDVPAKNPGRIETYNIASEYMSHIRSFAKFICPINVVIDYANGMGVLEGEVLQGLMGIEPLFNVLDGTFPNHEANPLHAETFEPLQNRIRSGKYDFGIYFDGDADRAGFTDERGEIVSNDMITALIAQAILEQEKGVVFYDLRSSWAVKEVIAEAGGEPRMSRVGHAFIKEQMREAAAVFAGELSGHYYFRENYYAESAALAAIMIGNLISHSGKTLSELVKPILRYYASGEINSRVDDVEAVFARLRKAYPTGKIIELDGLSMEFDNWWFNVRASNTEPLVRLNLEAGTQADMEWFRGEVLALIRGEG
jgi:phosphomannomutase